MAKERVICLHLSSIDAKAQREHDFSLAVGQVLSGLADFQKEALDLFAKYKCPTRLLRYLQFVPNWPDDPFDAGKLAEPVDAQELAAFHVELCALLRNWGLGDWPNAMHAMLNWLQGIAAAAAKSKVWGFIYHETRKHRESAIRFSVEVDYDNKSQADCEREIVKAVRAEVRRQYKANRARVQQPGGKADFRVTRRNLTWYFLHKRGKSYSEVIQLWKQDHPTQKLDTTNERDVSKVKKGIHDVVVKLGDT
jgi:hypothetical protein